MAPIFISSPDFYFHLLSWDPNGQGRPVVSVATTMVTRVMISCLAAVWWRRVLRLLASHGGSMAIVNLATNMGLTHAPSTLKEVDTLMMHHHHV